MNHHLFSAFLPRFIPQFSWIKAQGVALHLTPGLGKRVVLPFFVLFIGFSLVVAVLAGINRVLVQPAFLSLEQERAIADNDRVLAALQNELAELASLAIDWANWEDAYTFAQGANPDFIAANYSSASTLSRDSGIDLLALFDINGRPLLHGAYDPAAKQEVRVRLFEGPTSADRQGAAPLLKQSPRQGLVQTEHGILLLAIQPILHIDGRGPASGTLCMGRFLTEQRVQRLSRLTKVAIQLAAPDQSPAASAVDPGSDPAEPAMPPLINGQEALRLLVDIDNKPLALIKTPVTGEISALGQRTGRILLVALSCMALVMLLMLAAYRRHVKVSQLALVESESRYRTLFESESDALFLIDNADGRILEANNAAESLYGYTREELLQMANTDLSAEQEQTQTVTQSIIPEVDQIVFIPLRFHRKKDQQVFPVEITGRFFTYRGRKVHIAAVRDISQRKQTEDRLRFTQLAVDCLADGAFWLDQKGRFTYVNQEACRSLGYSREELLVLDVTQIDPAFPFEQWAEYWQELKAKGSMLLESSHKAKDGTVFPVEIRSNFIAFDGQEYNCALVRDIRQRKQMEQERLELESVTWQLQKEESLGRMAGAIAHHFNNHLAAVIGFLQFQQTIAGSAGDEGNASGNISHALHAARRAASISSMMLTYLGQTVFAVQQPIGLGVLITRHIPMLKALVPADVSLLTDLPNPGPMVTVNEGQVQQILINLITNSIEAIGPRPGVITLSFDLKPADEIASLRRFPVDWRPGQEWYACLDVADNGCGIAADTVEKLFDPFYTTKFEGRGLGLPVALGLTKSHKGAMAVSSTPDKGSCFQVILPLSADQTPPSR